MEGLLGFICLRTRSVASLLGCATACAATHVGLGGSDPPHESGSCVAPAAAAGAPSPAPAPAPATTGKAFSTTCST
jgi:hypothetical protein